MGAGESLRRVLECVASGILLEGELWAFYWIVQQRECLYTGIKINILIFNFIRAKDGPGIKDPCEKETVDATANLTVQQREDITQSAQVIWGC